MSDDAIRPGTPHRRIVGGVPCAEIDLSNGAGILPGRIRHRLAGLFGGISGVGVQRLGVTTKGQVSVEMQGWSPSLHRIDIQYARDMGGVAPEDLTTHMVDKAFMDAIVEQGERSKAGMFMELHAPLPLRPSEPASAMRNPVKRSSMFAKAEMRHLLVDASLPAVAASDGEDLDSMLRKLLDETHRAGKAWEGGSYVSDLTGHIIECGLGRVIGAEVDVTLSNAPGGGYGTYDGLALHLRGVTLPETVLIHAAGRPLGDMIKVHPALDGRVVQMAETEAGAAAMVVRFEPSLIEYERMADAIALHADADS